ncbi:hypothetical protein D0Z07_5263 [Hyphodiscus hymeniophilus]|uniref:Methyltransferase domain-containing protein n=1 Tax=Hyphodiscus hymeniophilus TaxID=353542 RepID=A0A9P7AWT8_9HELO|nr:hypothetical protein D0Z07_5263 [Hyphodiscus hymeniophilus]
MEELYHRCKISAPMKFLFTTVSGHVVEVNSGDLPITSPYSPRFDPNIKVPTIDQCGPFTLPVESLTYFKTKKLRIDTTDGPSDAKAESPGHCSAIGMVPPIMIGSRTASSSSNFSDAHESTIPSPVATLSMVYNEYGELVSAYDVLHPPKSKDMSVLQILRIIKKTYHHSYRDKIGEIISLHMEGKSTLMFDDSSCILGFPISAWELKLRSPESTSPTISRGGTPAVAVYNGPPRVLEIGCGDGSWCFQVKQKYSEWIVEGIDDTDHWSCEHKDINLRDFIVSGPTAPTTDYLNCFSTVNVFQDYPEFTVRNINQLLKHSYPIPHNLYGLIRARDIFDKIESWKTFLEDVRLTLQPDGVVEFLEIDRRPRLARAGPACFDIKEEHTSGPEIDWTDIVADRFKDKSDEQLGNEIPGWMGRVTEDLKATLRPRDGVPGPKLKSWLEGSGFWDVKQTVIRLPVGGNTKAGQLLKDYMLLKHYNEDCVPNLKTALPAIETEAIESGEYYLNLHIVTGRKPGHPRAGDLLLNGTRQEMTNSKYEAMARTEDPKSNQWKRFDLGVELNGMINGLTNLSGAPSAISSPAAVEPRNFNPPKRSPLLGHDGNVDEAFGSTEQGREKVEAIEVANVLKADNDEGDNNDGNEGSEVLTLGSRSLSELGAEIAGSEP